MTAPDALPRQRRFVGIDLARFAAIVGMMAAHLFSGVVAGPGVSPITSTISALVSVAVSSTAATTFAVLGGVSLVLLSRSMQDAPAWRILISIAIRGMLIALIGWGLMQLHSPISVVLPYFGVAMILASFALWLPSWAVGALAGILWLFGAAVNAGIRAGMVEVPTAGLDVERSIRDLLLTGHYPAITWTAYMLAGILIARLLLAARAAGTLMRVSLWLGGVGLAVYLAMTLAGRAARTWPTAFGLPDIGEQILASGRGAPAGTEFWMLLIPASHTGSPADMLRTVAGACFLIGALVALVDARDARIGFFVASIRAAGAAPLTIYSAHVIATAAWASWRTQQQLAGHVIFSEATWMVFAAQLIGVIAIGMLITALRTRGPLEALLGWVSGSSRVKRVRVPISQVFDEN